MGPAKMCHPGFKLNRHLALRHRPFDRYDRLYDA
jgi:hypothetical protein